MAALGQLVSGIAHELNNPLTTISGYTQLLLGRGLPAACIPDARKLYQEAERARRIVKDLLYFARQSKPERLPVDVNEVIERTLALRSYELKIANIAIHLRSGPRSPKNNGQPYPDPTGDLEPRYQLRARLSRSSAGKEIFGYAPAI